MKALMMNEYKKLDYGDVPNPNIEKPNEILVRVKAVAICGSDVHGFDGSSGRRKPPIIMGHEASGEVVTTGSGVTKFKKGDRITFDSTIYCGSCWYCQNGQPNLCEDRMVLGCSCDDYRRHGCFAEYVVVPEHICYHIADEVSFEEAAMVEPSGVAAHAIRQTPYLLNENIAIVGVGLIGLLVLKMLRPNISGRIIALDTIPGRLEMAKKFGADEAFISTDAEVVKQVQALTFGRGVDRSIEAVGATAPIKTAIDITRKGGSVSLIGNVSPTVEIPLQSVVTRQLSLIGSCAIAGEYPIVLDMMARKKLDVMPIVSKVAPLSEGHKWMTKLYNREDNLLKVVLKP
jgi:(R,R)-butanediol dehydrogenase/meso-butanediol dehydrogenase/diacetyl reductase/L-iditol 2-dehydrogenase